MIKNYFKIALRNLWKNKLGSSINIIGLSLGISVCIVILIFVQYESSFDSYHQKAGQTYRVVQHNTLPDQMQYWNTTAYPLAEALRSDFPEIDLVTQTAGPVSREFRVDNGTSGMARFEVPQVLFVDPFYPKTFDVDWIVGNPNTALSDINSVVLTEDLAQTFFGVDANNYSSVLGKTIFLQSKDPLTITGVVKNPPGNSDQRYALLVPYEFFRINNPFFSSNWSGNYQGTTFVVLQDEIHKAPLESKIAGWKKKYLKPEDDTRISYFLQPLTEIHNETLYGNSINSYTIPIKLLTTAAIIALFILIIAIINFVNLLTAQSNSRAKEVGIRKVMGSKKSDVVLQFLFENTLMIITTLGLSLLLAQFMIHQLNQNLSIIELQLEFGWEHMGIILFIGILSVLLGAIYPAMVLSAFQPIQALKKNTSGIKIKGIHFRKSLVTFQFIVVQLFVIAAIILTAQMNLFKEGSLGFTSDDIVITDAPEFDKLETFKNLLIENKDIAKVSFGSGPPMAVNGFQLGTSYRLPEQPPEEALEAEMKIGDLNYLEFYDLELLAGRNFLANKQAFDEFIVNEAFLKSYGWTPQEAIGKRIQINEGQATIVGVVEDYHNNSLQYRITPCILLNWNSYQHQAFIKMEHSNNATLGAIKDIWETTFPISVYRYGFLEDAIAKEYAVEDLIFKGFRVFSILAISIGCLGLFGLMSFLIAQKTKEIGIRKILGASMFQNISFFTKEFAGLVILAFVIATPIVYYLMNLWLEGFTHRIQMTFWMYLIGGMVTLFIAIVTCSFQSIKASLANPIKALRED